MIDWLNTLYHAIWILGLAMLLAVFSLAHWRASLQEKPLHQSLSEPPSRLVIFAGIALFALGLMLLVTPWWHKIGWIGIMVLSLWEGFAAWQDWSGKTKRS